MSGYKLADWQKRYLEAMRKAAYKRGLTQEKCAELLEVARSTVGRWFRQQQFPESQGMRWAIEDVLGVKISDYADVMEVDYGYCEDSSGE